MPMTTCGKYTIDDLRNYSIVENGAKGLPPEFQKKFIESVGGQAFVDEMRAHVRCCLQCNDFVMLMTVSAQEC